MPDLEPITRTEKLWSGEDLDPVTRKEMYIKHLYDETQVIPDHPVTREEIFILKAGEELHDVTIEQLTATENGTYSEQGVAYSPVIVEVPEPTLITKSITENGTYNASADNADGYSSVEVNVPLPENAYLLKSVTTPTPIASFTDGEEMVMPTLKVAIEPVQDLHGYDAPWPAGGGANKWDEEWETGTFNTTTGANIDYIETQIRSKNYIPILADTNYYIKGGDWLIFFDENKNVITDDLPRGDKSGNSVSITDNTFKTPQNSAYMRFYRTTTYGSVYNNDIAINYPSSVTSYAPYSNICPISGWSSVNVIRFSKNYLDPNDTDYGNYQYTNDGTIVYDSFRLCSRFYPCSGNESFTMKRFDGGTVQFLGIVYFDENKTFLGRTTANETNVVSGTTPSNCKYIRVFLSYGSGTVTPSVWGTQQIQLEKNATATIYEPYAGSTYTIDLDGTRYGGELDVVSGTMTVDMKTVDLSTLSWSTTSLDRQIALLPDAKPAPDNNTKAKIFCDRYPTDTANALISKPTEFLIAINDNKGVMCRTSDGNTPQGQLVYELATPLTIQLTPTQVKSLLGSNNVWADTGDITDAEYFSKEV